MRNGIAGLRGYQEGGILERLRRLKPLFFGERSETGYIPEVPETYEYLDPDSFYPDRETLAFAER